MRDDGLEAVDTVELQSETREALVPLLPHLLLRSSALALAFRPRNIGRPCPALERRGIAATADDSGCRGELGLHLQAEELGAEEVEGAEDGIHGRARFFAFV